MLFPMSMRFLRRGRMPTLPILHLGCYRDLNSTVYSTVYSTVTCVLILCVSRSVVRSAGSKHNQQHCSDPTREIRSEARDPSSAISYPLTSPDLPYLP